MFTHIYDLDGEARDLAMADLEFEEAARKGLAEDPNLTLEVARRWGSWCERHSRWHEASGAYRHALEAIDKVFQLQLLWRGRTTFLSKVQGYAGRASYAAAMAGDAEAAVEIIEQGSAIQLADALERNSLDEEGLKAAGRNDLAARYRAIVEQIRPFHFEEWGMAQLRTVFGYQPVDFRAAFQEIEKLIEEVRTVPGCERFLKPLRHDDIRAIAGTVPLIYLIAAPKGGLALMVGSKAETIWLPALTQAELDAKVGSYLVAYLAWRDDPREGAKEESFRRALTGLTHWLWQSAMGPIVQASAGAGKIVLVPCGALAALPMHAAWTRDQDSPTGRRYALDRIAIAYAPNARSLAYAHETAATGRRNMLVAVEQPQPSNSAPLPHAEAEVRAVTRLFRNPHVNVIRGKDAKRDAVLAAIAGADVLHFCCHGTALAAHPLDSGLVMAEDVLLSLRDFLDMHNVTIRLAVLSACETGIPHPTLPDEIVSLPSGLLQAGVAGVVSSLWSIKDRATALLMARFHQLQQASGDPVLSLCRAQRWLRDATQADLTREFPDLMPEGAGEAAGMRLYGHPFFWGAFRFDGT